MPHNTPTPLTVALSVLAGVLSVLNVAAFGFEQPWQELITAGLAILAALGISPVVGPKLQNILHISHAAALSLAVAFAAASTLVSTVSGLDQAARGIIGGLLSVVAGTLFGPAPPPPPPAAPSRARKR